MPNTKEINYLKMFKDIANVCMTENVCGRCQEKGCFVGYARECIGDAKKKDTDTLEGAYLDIPVTDVKGGYDRVHTLETIGHTLKQCKSCKEYHYDDCLVNIVRTCFEVIAFGDAQHYNGSAFQYLTTLQEKYPDEALEILTAYKSADDDE